jgi:hypothetical protein
MQMGPPPSGVTNDAATTGTVDAAANDDAQPTVDPTLPPPDASPSDVRPPSADVVRPVDRVVMDAASVETRPPMDVAPELPAPVMACTNPTMPGEVGVFDIGAGGNCSFPAGSLPMYVVSVDQQMYAAGTACGTCIEVTHGTNKVIAQVVDQYPVPPGPRGNKMSLGRAAFSKLTGGLTTGLLPMPWRRVPCPVTGPITASLKNGSSVFYWEVLFQNVSNPIASVEFMNATDLKWTNVKRESYNYFRQPSAAGLPARFRLTDVHGNFVVTPPLSWPQNPVTQPIPIGTQFPTACVP